MYAALLFHGNLGHLGKPFPWLVKRFVKELYVGKYGAAVAIHV